MGARSRRWWRAAHARRRWAVHAWRWWWWSVRWSVWVTSAAARTMWAAGMRPSRSHHTRWRWAAHHRHSIRATARPAHHHSWWRPVAMWRWWPVRHLAARSHRAAHVGWHSVRRHSLEPSPRASGHHRRWVVVEWIGGKERVPVAAVWLWNVHLVPWAAHSARVAILVHVTLRTGISVCICRIGAPVCRRPSPLLCWLWRCFGAIFKGHHGRCLFRFPFSRHLSLRQTSC